MLNMSVSFKLLGEPKICITRKYEGTDFESSEFQMMNTN